MPRETFDVALALADAKQQHWLCELLAAAGYSVQTLDPHPDRLDHRKFRVLIADPDHFERLRDWLDPARHDHPHHTHVILISSDSDTDSLPSLLDVDDYLRTPLQRREVIARVKFALKYRQLQCQLSQAAITDGLTGLHTHDHFHRLLSAELKRSRRFGDRVSLLLIDIDNFQAIADTFGHLAACDLLVRVCQTIRMNLRDVDSLARIGANKLAAILPQAGIHPAGQVAERVRKAVECTPPPTPIHDYTVTCSIGVAGTDDPRVHSAASLVHWAEQALAKAKQGGKNRVVPCTALGEGAGLIEHASVEQLRRQMISLSLQAKETYMESVASLLQALDEKDPYTARHAENTAFYARCIAQEMGLDVTLAQIIYNAALLHDIGKVGVPDAILMKHAPLTPLERMVLEQVPLISTRIVDHLRILEAEVPFIRHQREYYDGSGLPSGLVGEQIPIGSRILLVADAFDAMTTERVYRHRISMDAALIELQRNAGRQFDPGVVEAFERVMTRDRAIWQQRIDESPDALPLPACTQHLE